MTSPYILNINRLKKEWADLRGNNNLNNIFIPYWTEGMAEAIQRAIFSLDSRFTWGGASHQVMMSYIDVLSGGNGGAPTGKHHKRYIHMNKNFNVTYTISANMYEGSGTPDRYKYLINMWRRRND